MKEHTVTTDEAMWDAVERGGGDSLLGEYPQATKAAYRGTLAWRFGRSRK